MVNETIKVEKKKLVKILILTALAGMIVFGILFTVFCKITGRILISSEEYSVMNKISSRYEKLYILQEKMNSEGYFKVSEDKQMDAVYKGLVKSLKDPYSEYFTAKEAKTWNDYVNGTFYGIGVVFGKSKNGEFLISEVIEKSPAENSGIKKYDVIMRVDGKTYKTSEELRKAIMGKAGTKVKLTVKRDKSLRDVEIIRGKVTEKTVKGIIGKNNVGYIRISSFAEKTADEFKTELAYMEKKNVKGVVIDLRDNGGGYAQQGVKIADMLLPEGTIMYIKDNKGKKSYFNSKPGATKLKYVLLINGNTASTAEILTAAVKDNKGGKIVGTGTYGKGIMQAEFPFKDGSALKLTTNQYFSPKGHQIHKKGISPDYEVKLTKEDKTDTQLERALKLIN
ncbi:MAG: S41 family peptidase [Hornefia sp.]|nr:S41 family peptidase [Hornefia sp.]